jgi:hypothetical protein
MEAVTRRRRDAREVRQLPLQIALLTAGLGPSAEHALISLLALNGLRISEATGVMPGAFAEAFGP